MVLLSPQSGDFPSNLWLNLWQMRCDRGLARNIDTGGCSSEPAHAQLFAAIQKVAVGGADLSGRGGYRHHDVADPQRHAHRPGHPQGQYQLHREDWRRDAGALTGASRLWYRRHLGWFAGRHGIWARCSRPSLSYRHRVLHPRGRQLWSTVADHPHHQRCATSADLGRDVVHLVYLCTHHHRCRRLPCRTRRRAALTHSRGINPRIAAHDRHHRHSRHPAVPRHAGTHRQRQQSSA